MSKKLYVIFALTMAATILLTACGRSAGPSTLPTATSNATRAVGGGTDATPTGMSQLSGFATQTALAAQGITPGAGTANPTQASTSLVPPTGAATTLVTTPAATTPVTVPTATPGRPTTYTLQQGEYPYCIARRFNVDPQDLLDLNGLTSNSVLQPGEVLKIPQTGSFPGTRALHTHPATYTVAVNDTLYKIACYYGDIDPTAIAAANGLTPPYTLVAGRTLSIP